MYIQALQQQLADGKITKEQFAVELKKLLDAKLITQEEHDAAAKVDGDDKDKDKPMTPEQVQQMIADAVAKAEQSAADKVRTEYTAKLKKEQEEKDQLLKDKMTDEEKAKFEKEKYDKELADREAALNAREVELHIIDLLNDPSEPLPLSFKSFLVGATKEIAESNVKTLRAAWRKEIDEAVAKRFQDNGDDPTKRQTGGGGGTAKKWKDMNLTEQGKLYAEDRAKAIELAKADGIILN